jgi:hypothetical protein
MTETERELDLMIAELETENRMMRARNERLEKELAAATTERLRMQGALERIIAVSRVAIWDSVPKGVSEVGEKEREYND